MAKANIAILDYGLGNLFNLHRALHAVGGNAFITSDPEKIVQADMVVVPGVGAFGAGIENLKARGQVDALRECRASGKEILGICLGMQLLLTESEENGRHAGLDFFKGRVVRFQSDPRLEKRIKIPQISWNSVERPPGHSKDPWKHSLLRGLKEPVYMYFVHSYHVQVNDAGDNLGITSYGLNTFSSVIRQENVTGCQFHPERSGEQGLLMLKNFTGN